ncbi:Short chain dehydrogenase family protein [Burkholderiales bacterium]|nr:Short chain dehydrogenase family protein [Burkholderiales bacterium]
MTVPTAPSRNALVTGAAQRIGRAIALALAQDGWDVAIHYRGSQERALATVADIRALGRRAHAVACDLAAAGELEPLFGACEEALGPLQCIVNNASLFEADGAIDFTWARFESHMRVNVAAPLYLARALHARLAADASGVVVNLLDQKLWNPNPDFLSYTLSKAALETATGLLARSLAPKLRVVGVAPGITLPARGQSQAGFEAASRATPLGRASSPEDIARAVVFLVNAPAITGTTLLVDGGQHLVPTLRDVMFLKS